MDPQTYILIGVSVTLVLSLLAGAFALGKLFQRVDTITDPARQMTPARSDERTTPSLPLANHRHDVDGNILFIVPSGGD